MANSGSIAAQGFAAGNFGFGSTSIKRLRESEIEFAADTRPSLSGPVDTSVGSPSGGKYAKLHRRLSCWREIIVQDFELDHHLLAGCAVGIG